jgi:hypothetical protein
MSFVARVATTRIIFSRDAISRLDGLDAEDDDDEEYGTGPAGGEHQGAGAGGAGAYRAVPVTSAGGLAALSAKGRGPPCRSGAGHAATGGSPCGIGQALGHHAAFV